MKILISFALSLPLMAQEPLTYEAFGRLYSVGDFSQNSADGLVDLVVMNQSDGSYSVGFQELGGNMNWSPEVDSGFQSVSALVVGKFATTTSDDFAVTDPLENRVSFFRPDAIQNSPIVRHLYPSSPGTSQLTGVSLNGNRVQDLLSFSYDGSQETRQAFEGGSSLWQSNQDSRSSRLWTVRHERTGRAAPRVIYVNSGVLTSVLGNNSGLSDEKSFPGFVAASNAGLSYGWYDGTDQAHIVVFNPGTNVALSAKISGGASGWSIPAELTFPRALEALVSVPIKEGERLVALYQDRTVTAYDFDGVSLGASTTFAGEHELVVPLKNGRMLTRNGEFWQTWDASTGLEIRSGLLPEVASSSNILFVSAEPFANPTAEPVFAGLVGGWTMLASGGNESWTVTALAPSASGLGGEVTQLVNPSPGADFALVNQYRRDVSVNLISVTPGVPSGEVLITPNGGNFAPLNNEILPVSVSFSSTFPSAQVFYRLGNSGAWSLDTGDLEIKEPTTLQAYAEWKTQRSPVRQAVFMFSDLPDLAASALDDSNGNGISDQWEESFGISDPNADDDGDGESNLTEFQNGTDPRNAASFSQLPENTLTAQVTSDGVIIRWPVSLGDELQESPDLQSWEQITEGIVQRGNVYEYRVTEPQKSFYRLRP